jgi:hypothetical protein
MLSKLIDEADKFAVVEPGVHARILAAVDGTPPVRFSLAERFRAASYLQLATLYLAQQHNWTVEKDSPDGKGGRASETLVDESRLPAEIAALHKILDSFSYSPALADMIARRREDFIRELAGDRDFGIALLRWPEMAEEERRAFVHDTVAQHLRGYSIPGVDISVPPFSFDTGIKTAAAVTETEFIREGDTAVPVARAIKAGAGLRDAELGLYAVVLAYHESVHALLTSLAAAAAREKIHPGDPFYDDAALALAYRRDWQAVPFIPSVYQNDVEEKLVYATERHFMNDLIETFIGGQPPPKDAPPAGPERQIHCTPG